MEQKIEPVLTAHPTQVMRRTILSKNNKVPHQKTLHSRPPPRADQPPRRWSVLTCVECAPTRTLSLATCFQISEALARRDSQQLTSEEMEEVFAAAKPGRGHRALASLYRAGKVPAVITQNIDNLHQASGFAAEHVVELHGNTTFARCIGCGQAYPLDWVRRRFDGDGAAPNCTACDEPVKTATISFGQMMPDDEMQRATALSRSCDLFIAIGSSLVVWPAAGFPLMAKRAGARLAIINREPTEQDDIADLVIHHDIGETLGPFVGN
jgi:NAD-dependent deacetylase